MRQQDNSHILETLRNSLTSVWDLLESENVQELMINGPDDIWVEQGGKLTRVDRSLSATQIESAIHILGRINNKDVIEHTSDSIVDARLEGLRIAAAIRPISVTGPSLAIRKHMQVVLSLENYVATGAITEEVAQVLRRIVREHKNILVVGGTSSGKTTFLNALIREVPEHERIVTIEDTQELKVSAPNWVPLEANEQAGITCRQLLKLALRYRPDRILVGEVRGPEAYDLLQAANTGHDGVMATLHASSAKQGLTRLETLILTANVGWPHEAVRVSVAETFHYIVFLARRNGVRQVEQILQMQGYDHKQQQYQFDLLLDRKEQHA
ncbi:ATPase, T2SS/T4P/T4SS family [Crenobacter sp. SG2305]|uniref:CpaF family protein n=1 Tax=Crenobacter oryzisoli TaxID=3056844 RepID=UPI0025AAA828|nr:ATPase, T2SS/T4P/T4SS family [Crenobacter sp. SG2305]MDN0082492.1 ATPase, T2SS/T4P/T4SS family [Crenobacter sp. SG2305]